MAEIDPSIQRRSSSQASSLSRRSSQRARTIRSKPQKTLSTASNAPTDLTSFPSLSPDSSPEGFRGQPALNRALSQALLAEEGVPEDVNRGRQATLEKLTSSLPRAPGRAALFDESQNTRDVPGALHLASDEHIERLIARTGAVKLIRQFARDMALRDAEISSLRLRADEREKELKKMLREVEVSNHDIERRLYALENPPQPPQDSLAGEEDAPKPTSGIDGMINQAMLDGVGAQARNEGPDKSDLQATIKPTRNDYDTRSTTSSNTEFVQKRRSTFRGWGDLFWSSNPTSRKTSRASSVISEADSTNLAIERATYMPSSSSARRRALDEQLFQPPSAREVQRSEVKDSDGDEASRKSNKSIASWTVKLFAGNSSASKEPSASGSVRSVTPSMEQGKNRSPSSTLSAASKPTGAAVAALRRINSTAGVNSLPKGGSMRESAQALRRNGTPKAFQNTGSDLKPNGTATNLGPVEMDAILPMETKPPTLTHPYNNYQAGEFLTDRFGFIYDQRRKKRQKEALVADNKSKRLSMSETIKSFRSDSDLDHHGEIAGAEPSLDNIAVSPGPSTPAQEEPEGGATTSTRKWQDYFRVPVRPTELLSHTPSAGPILTPMTGGDPRQRAPSVAVDKSGSFALSTPVPSVSASTSPVVANFAEASTPGSDDSSIPKPSTSEQEPVKLLLEQLTDLHDSLQRERTVKWNEFLRKVRAERRKEGQAAAAIAPDRANMSLAMPEASLTDGEVVGIAGLGNKGKIGRAKWREFRSLVLGGIPVAHRAKIWSECSGASALRVPGYYDDLVHGKSGMEPDPTTVSQIEMDIHRTLTDNVFFRKGPGVAKLNEVLLAYSRRNPEVGYCQGMNLITASLLLICPTAEDAFWILTSLIENILPQHYYDHGFLGSRADQQVLRQYVSEILPRLSAHLDDLGVELEALTFQWFLSVFTDCLSAEALYRVWDVILCLNAPSTPTNTSTSSPANNTTTNETSLGMAGTANATKRTPIGSDGDVNVSGGGGSTFLFQVALALLKLNEQQLLTTCSTPAAIYTYINHQMTNHAISIDALIEASEALRSVVRVDNVLARRAAALKEMKEAYGGDDGSIN